MNIIIVGCGRVGRSIAEQLNTEEHSITVIDESQRALDRIDDTQNILTIQGNGATYNILEEADIKNTNLLIAVTPTDELNLYTCILAKQVGVQHTIARVRNPQYVRDVKKISEKMMPTLMINPEETAAKEIARLLRYSGAKKVESIGQGVGDLITIKVAENSLIANRQVQECSEIIRKYVMICLVERGEDVYIPNGDFTIQEGDLVSFITPAKFSNKLLKLLGFESKKGDNVLILGGGKISYYLAQELLESSMKVKIIEKKEDRCEHLSDELSDTTVICGDAMDESLITAEGIERADSIVSLLATDEENVLVSLYAKKVNEKANVVTELGNLKLSSIVDSLPLDRTIYPKQLTGEYIVRYVRGISNAAGSDMKTMYKFANGKVEALEFYVKEEGSVTGTPLSKLNLKSDLQIVSIIRNNRIIVPTGNDTIEKGDNVFIITKHKGLSELNGILR